MTSKKEVDNQCPPLFISAELVLFTVCNTKFALWTVGEVAIIAAIELDRVGSQAIIIIEMECQAELSHADQVSESICESLRANSHEFLVNSRKFAAGIVWRQRSLAY